MKKEIENKEELNHNFQNLEKLNSELLEKIGLLEIENIQLKNKNKELEKKNDYNSLISENEIQNFSKIKLNIEFLNNEIEDKKSQNEILLDLLKENQEEINTLTKTNKLFENKIKEKNEEIELLKKEFQILKNKISNNNEITNEINNEEINDDNINSDNIKKNLKNLNIRKGIIWDAKSYEIENNTIDNENSDIQITQNTNS